MEILWFAARTIANAELNMRDYLENRHILCFVPTTFGPDKTERNNEPKETLLIKNLIFFKTDYATANMLFSVNKRKMFCIRNKNGLVVIPEKQMNEFIAFIHHYGAKIAFSNHNYLIGDRMKIKSGPFAGMEGVITRIDNKHFFTLVFGELLNLTVRFSKSNLIKI